MVTQLFLTTTGTMSLMQNTLIVAWMAILFGTYFQFFFKSFLKPLYARSSRCSLHAVYRSIVIAIHDCAGAATARNHSQKHMESGLQYRKI